MGSSKKCERVLSRLDVQAEVLPFSRFCRLARLARREMTLAGHFGDLSKELLRDGRAEDARRIAWGAFCHWRVARRALRRIDPCTEVFNERIMSLSA